MTRRCHIAAELAAALLLWAGSTRAQNTPQYVTTGTGGVTLNSLVVEDASNPTQFIVPLSSGACGAGFALAAATQGNTFPLSSTAGAVQRGIAANNVTAGDILVVVDGGWVSPPMTYEGR
jgi:hypothetical protein